MCTKATSKAVLLCTVLWRFAFLPFSCGLNLDQCVSGLVQVPDTTSHLDDFLSCTGIPDTHTVYWKMIANGGPIAIGSCPPLPASCTLLYVPFKPLFTIRRPSNGVSHISWVRGQTRILTTVAWFHCYSGADTSNIVQCRVDVVYPAEGVTCDVQFNTPPFSSWTVSGRCDVTKIYSYRDIYSCTWYQSDGSSSQPVSASLVAIAINQSTTDPNYKSAICTLSGHPMPLTSATYKYSVVISPGSGPVIAEFSGPNVVRAPNTPINNCPQDFVQESSRLDCTCSSDDMGSPAGRLVWKGISSSAQLLVNNVSRSLNSRQYTCQLLWNPSAAIGTNIYTLTVAYPPQITSVTLNGSQGVVTVNESNTKDVMLSCTASARPSSDLQLLKNSDSELVRILGGSVTNTETTVTHTFVARCEASGLYVCLAHNAVGDAAEKTVNLNVLCSPRLSPSSESHVPILVNFKGAAVHFTLNLMAKPVPDRFSFLYRGRTLNKTSREPTRINMFEIKCARTDSSRALCVITVINVTETDVGFYDVIMVNSVGVENCTFQVRFNESEPEPESLCNCGPNIGAIVGGCLGVTIAVVIVVAVCIWCRRRREAKRGKDNPPAMPAVEIIMMYFVQVRDRWDSTNKSVI